MNKNSLHTKKSIKKALNSVKWIDVLFISLFIPLVLYLFFLLPRDISSYLVLSSEVFYPWAVFTSAFIHFGMGHLASNIGYFVVFGLTGYWLLFRTGKRKVFLLLLGMFLFIVPPIASSLSISLTFLKTTHGFSAVVSALLGLIPVALAYYLKKNSVELSFENLCFSFLLIGVSIILLKYLDNLLLGIIFFAVIITLGLILLYEELTKIDLDSSRLTGKMIYFSFLSFVIYFAGLYFSIPGPGTAISASGPHTNVLSHYIGFLLGVIISYIVIKKRD